MVTLDPGHFHAALVQKVSYPQVSKDVYVYAPTGFDVDEHLKRIQGFNTRAENPTAWNEIVYTGDDYLEKMLAEKKGNVMIQAGNNGKKTEYIKKTLEAGINVLSDKPMAINSQSFKLLEECFAIAKHKNIMLYDIMTERNEITTMLQRELSTIPAVYGEQLKGSPEEPAIVKESVHHLFKLVDNKPLTRPVWYLDVNQQGEGIVDVTTHLVDLVQWEAFPDQIIDYKKDIELIDANRWTTSISPEEFKQVTGTDAYPDFLKKDVENDTLKVYCNGDIVYKIKGVTAKVSVIWNYTFPKGEKNESSLDVINKDLRYLEGEKVQFDIDGEYAKSRQRAFRVYAVLLVVFFAVVVAVCTLMQIVYGADTTIFMLIGALLSAVAGSFVLLTYQSYSDEVKSAAASKNKAVTLENRVKIKYVSIKNAVDYTYEKYHVKNSKEFVYNYEQYLLAVKDKERFRRTNEDLEYNSKKLVSVLSKNDFYDARVWLNYTNAIVDHKEMVEQKHELIVRRQKLRGRMSCNVETITRLRREILSHRNELGDRIHEVNRILNKIAELDMEVQSED